MYVNNVVEQTQEDLIRQLNEIAKIEISKPNAKPIEISPRFPPMQVLNQEVDLSDINKKLADLTKFVEAFRKHDDEIKKHSQKLEDHDSRFKNYDNEIKELNDKLDALEARLKLCEDGLLKKADLDEIQRLLLPVSYTHLTLPTKRIV